MWGVNPALPTYPKSGGPPPSLQILREGLHICITRLLRGRAEQQELRLRHHESAGPLLHKAADHCVDLCCQREGAFLEVPRAGLCDQVAVKSRQPALELAQFPQRPLEVATRAQHLAAVEAEIAHAPVAGQLCKHTLKLLVKVLTYLCEVIFEDQRPPAVAVDQSLPRLPVRQRATAPTEGQVLGALVRPCADGGALLALGPRCCALGRLCDQPVGNQL
mmetsp:Transcript_45838/g.130872  ORF Transcript_45838/g.130872 Transcript_45838/m.130872 type:complete len:219 (-) Transcript_45838:3709-4365(-)